MTYKNIIRLHVQQFASELGCALRKFRDDTSGGLSVEFLFVFPLLIWAYIGMFAFFHAFRTQGLNLRASYAVADFVTRQTEPISQRHLDGMLDVFEFMVGGEYNNWIRLTSVQWDQEDDQYEVVWSHATDDNVTWTTETLNSTKRDELPVMAQGDYAIIVETKSDYVPVFSVPEFGINLQQVTFDNFIFTTNRQVGRVCWVERCEN